ncbi:MAG: hypothetical protein WC829_03200 [Hyphomicrobium sp.]|jgi:hypothetical protein
MNCKPGDLAIIVRSEAGNLGKIVRCIKVLRNEFWTGPSLGTRMTATLEIDIPLASWDGVVSNHIADDQLRPIRDNDGEDEMIRIAGLPHKEIA